MLPQSNMSASFTAQLPLTAAVGVSIFGWLLNFIGIAVLQCGLPKANFNPIGLSWYFVFLYLLWAASLFGSILYNSIETYRNFLLQLTTVVLASIPFDIEKSLAWAQFQSSGGISAGGSMKVAGLVIMFFAVLPVLAILGSGKDSIVHDLNSAMSAGKSETPAMVNNSAPRAMIPASFETRAATQANPVSFKIQALYKCNFTLT